MIATLEVFDPPMCCSTGVCGPDVDPALVRFAADLEWLAAQGVAVRRHNLAQDPAAFAAHPVVAGALEQGLECLPLVLADGREIARGGYPGRADLAGHLGPAGAAAAPAGALLAELCAVAAAVATGSEPAYRMHLAAAGAAGAGSEEVRVAVAAGRSVGRELRGSVDEAVAETLGPQAAPAPAPPSHPLLAVREAAPGACCSPGAGDGCC